MPRMVIQHVDAFGPACHGSVGKVGEISTHLVTVTDDERYLAARVRIQNAVGSEDGHFCRITAISGNAACIASG